jgi:transposase-like protein
MRTAKTTTGTRGVVVRRKHRTAQQRREMVEAYERSGLSQVEFCEREAVSTASLANWRRQVLEGAAKPASAASVRATPKAAFIELGSTRPLEAGLRVRIELGAGVVLELSRG